MNNRREPSPEEEKLVCRLSELLDPADVGLHLSPDGDKVLLYAMVPMESLPAGIIGASAVWLCQALGGPNNLGRMTRLLSQAVKQWLTERSEGVPIVA